MFGNGGAVSCNNRALGACDTHLSEAPMGGALIVQTAQEASPLLMPQRFVEADRDGHTCHGRTQNRPGGRCAAGPATRPERTGGTAERRYGKIKSHLTCGASQRRLWASREARPFRGTSWLTRTRASRCVSLGAQPNCAPTVVTLPVAGVLLAVILARALDVNLSASAPRGCAGWLLDCRRAGPGWWPV